MFSFTTKGMFPQQIPAQILHWNTASDFFLFRLELETKQE